MEHGDCTEIGHDYVFLRSSKRSHYDTWQSLYQRTDYYYCRRCLEQKEIKREESARVEPEWWRAE